MNPFVNPNKRSINLPSGCKDLGDVLKLQRGEAENPILTFVRLMLLQAENMRASQVIIGPVMVPDGECIVNLRVKGALSFFSNIPADFRSGIVAVLLGLAKLPQNQFPADGVVRLELKRRELRWRIEIEKADAECVLNQSLVQSNDP